MDIENPLDTQVALNILKSIKNILDNDNISLVALVDPQTQTHLISISQKKQTPLQQNTPTNTIIRKTSLSPQKPTFGLLQQNIITNKNQNKKQAISSISQFQQLTDTHEKDDSCLKNIIKNIMNCFRSFCICLNQNHLKDIYSGKRAKDIASPQLTFQNRNKKFPLVKLLFQEMAFYFPKQKKKGAGSQNVIGISYWNKNAISHMVKQHKFLTLVLIYWLKYVADFWIFHYSKISHTKIDLYRQAIPEFLTALLQDRPPKFKSKFYLKIKLEEPSVPCEIRQDVKNLVCLYKCCKKQKQVERQPVANHSLFEGMLQQVKVQDSESNINDSCGAQMQYQRVYPILKSIQQCVQEGSCTISSLRNKSIREYDKISEYDSFELMNIVKNYGGDINSQLYVEEIQFYKE